MKLSKVMRFIIALPDKVTLRGKWETKQVWVNGEEVDPVLSRKVVDHSRDGFNWNYSGSGPAQLALTILMEFLPAHLALLFYSKFKDRVIAKLPAADFETTLDFRNVMKKIVEDSTI